METNNNQNVNATTNNNSTPNYFGRENQFVELKASFVMPPKDAKQTNQKKEICRKICGFLNSEGGTLYLGVADGGGVYKGQYKGIYNDILGQSLFLYYGGKAIRVRTNEEYRKFVKYHIGLILKESNKEQYSSFCDRIHIEPTDNDNVVQIDVRPALSCVVYLDGVAYQRDGEECIRMDATQIMARELSLRSFDTIVKEDRIRTAIKQKRQVTLVGYYSSSSNTIRDRHVEPIKIQNGRGVVSCYDIDKGEIRTFKFDRMVDVKLEKSLWEHEEEHRRPRYDLFNMSYCGQEFTISLEMSDRAMRWLCEARPNVQMNSFKKVANDSWQFDFTAYSLEPVRSFYLPWAKDVKIRESKDAPLLQDNIRRFVSSYLLNA